MTDIDWITPTIVVAIGLAAGLLLAFRGSRNATEGSSPDGASRREDLLRQKDRLLRAIREHQDTADFRDQSDGAETLLALEKEAAGVLRQLSLDSDDDPTRALSPETEAQRPEPGDDAPPPSGPSHMGLKFAGAALFAALLVFALLRGTSERTGDMQITGAGPEVSTIAKQAPMPTAGQPGGAIPGVPPALKPKPSGRVDRARARVSVEPKSELAWAELGYALLDAEGWIDAFQTAQSLREIAPGSPDARVIEAMVRVPMGQPDAAGTLLDEALGIDANHIMALTARGMIRYSGGNLTGAKEDWSRARKIAGPGKGHDELLAMASGSGPGGRQDLVDGRSPVPRTGDAAHSGEEVLAGPLCQQWRVRSLGYRTAEGYSSRERCEQSLERELALLGSDIRAEVRRKSRCECGSPEDPGPARAVSGVVSGVISLAAGEPAPDGGVLFIYARRPGQVSGPPVAVKRIGAPALPVAFQLGPQDQMIKGMPFPTTLDISARWDADGNAMTKTAEDPQASAAGVAAGASGVSLELTRP